MGELRVQDLPVSIDNLLKDLTSMGKKHREIASREESEKGEFVHSENLSHEVVKAVTITVFD